MLSLLQDRFQTAFLDKLNTNGAWSYMLVATELWLNLRLELVAVAALLGATLIAAAVRGKVGLHACLVQTPSCMVSYAKESYRVQRVPSTSLGRARTVLGTLHANTQTHKTTRCWDLCPLQISAALLGLALTYWQVITFYIQSAVKFSAEVSAATVCMHPHTHTHAPL